jgi:RHS repeat-associated protein
MPASALIEARVKVATSTYSYDLNGNLTQIVQGATTTSYAYDYLNRLATSTVGSVTTTYGYDAFGSRVFQKSGNVTTVYPNKWYSVVTASAATSTGTSTDYALLSAQAGQSDRLLATVDQPLVNGVATGSSTVRYVHTDNLGSTAVTSDTSGNLAQSFDYAPYGSVLASTNTGTTTTARQYIGQFADNSGLSYLQNRYYSSNQGQFISQDPAFLALGNAQQVQQMAQRDQQIFLADPQRLNAYSYGRDNPIVQSDPTGMQAVPVILAALEVYGVAQVGVDLYDTYNTDYRYQQVFSSQEKSQTNFKLGYDTTLGVLGESEVKAGTIVLGQALSGLSATEDALDTYFGKQIYKKYNEDQRDSAVPVVSSGTDGSQVSNPSTYLFTPVYSSHSTQPIATQHYSAPAGTSQLVQSLSQLVGSLNSLISQLSGNKARAP